MRHAKNRTPCGSKTPPASRCQRKTPHDVFFLVLTDSYHSYLPRSIDTEIITHRLCQQYAVQATPVAGKNAATQESLVTRGFPYMFHIYLCDILRNTIRPIFQHAR